MLFEGVDVSVQEGGGVLLSLLLLLQLLQPLLQQLHLQLQRGQASYLLLLERTAGVC